jgi:hypothetical protein
MRRDLERRLRAVELAGARYNGVELWIDQGDDTFRGPSGELLTGEGVEARRRTSGRFLLVMNKTDALL